MIQLSILNRLNLYALLNSGYKIIVSREDDVEMEDEEINDDESEKDEDEKNGNDKDIHEGSERMPDIEDIYKRDQGFSFAECF